MSKLKISKVTGKRAAVYLRRSTDAQEASITSQRQSVHEYAAAHDYEIVSEFVDSGISGVDSSLNRVQFQRLATAAERGDFDFVLVWDLSRLTRSDPMETMSELRPLKRAGVKLVTTDKPEPIDWDSVVGILMMTIEAESNNQYVRKLARGTTRGQSDIAKTGRWVAGRPPLGLTVNDEKRLIFGPSNEVEAIRYAFDEYAAGKSLRGVREGLASRGFNVVVSSVSWMLRNRLYCGDFVWGRYTQAKFYSVRGGLVSDDFDRGQTDEADQIMISDNHPAIIDRELFNRVQGMFNGRQKASTPTQNGGQFTLTRLLRCADCGYRMIGYSYRTSSGDKHCAYRCGGSQTKGVNFCHPHTAHQDDVLAMVFATFQDRFANPENIRLIKEEAKRQLESIAGKFDPKATERALTKEQNKLEKASRRLVEVDADLMDVVQKQIREIKQRIESLVLDSKKAAMSSKDVLREIDQRAEQAAEKFATFASAYKQADTAAIRAFLLQVVDHIKLEVTRSNSTGRWRYSLEGGELFLKQNEDLFDSFPRGKQVCSWRLLAAA